MINKFLVTLVTKWHLMSFWEQLAALGHALLDLVFIAILAALLKSGFSGDLVVFVALVPMFSVVVYFRLKQTRERWSL